MVNQSYRRAVLTVRAKVEANAAILSSLATALRVSADVPILRCSADLPSSHWISLMLSSMWGVTFK